jgi:hypothetical protein
MSVEEEEEVSKFDHRTLLECIEGIMGALKRSSLNGLGIVLIDFYR